MELNNTLGLPQKKNYERMNVLRPHIGVNQRIDHGDLIEIINAPGAIQRGTKVEIQKNSKDESYITTHGVLGRQIKAIFAGSLLSLPHN